MKVVWLGSYPVQEFADRITMPKLLRKRPHPATWLRTLGREVSELEDIELHIIAPSTYLDEDYHFTQGKIQFHLFWTGVPFCDRGWRNRFNPDRFTRFYYLRRRVLKTINRINPDIVNLHGTEGPMSFVVNHVRQPVVVEIQGFITTLHKLVPDRNNQFRLMGENLVLENQKDFIIHTRFMKDVILKKNPDPRFYYAHYPLSDSCFAMEEQPFRWDFCFYGRVVKEKGIEDFLDTLAIIKKHKPDFRAVIMGMIPNPGYFEQLKDIARKDGTCDQIDWVGFVPEHEDLLRNIKSSRMVIFPTHNDTSPGSVGESQGLGVPVVSWDIEGVPDMIEHGKTGMLADFGDVQGLANHALTLLDDPGLRTLVGANARDFARKHYKADSIARTMRDIYNTVLER